MNLDAEIEGKWLVKKFPALKGLKGVKISQGYLVITQDQEARIRQLGEQCFLTVKSGQGLVRAETEIKLSKSQFHKLWPATRGRRINKTRYTFKIGAFIGELDVYSGANKGLISIEVEFCSAEVYKRFIRPAWFGKEVTCNAKFKNKYLALHPRNSHLV